MSDTFTVGLRSARRGLWGDACDLDLRRADIVPCSQTSVNILGRMLLSCIEASRMAGLVLGLEADGKRRNGARRRARCVREGSAREEEQESNHGGVLSSSHCGTDPVNVSVG